MKEEGALKIAFISPEVVPFSKTGGLADVSGALPAELANLGHEVLVLTPLYHSIDRKRFGITGAGLTALVPVAGRMEPAEIHYASGDGAPEGLRTLFIGNEKYFDRRGLYGDQGVDYPDNGERFAFFSRAVLECMKVTGFKPDIIHGNDWQSGPMFPFLKIAFQGNLFFSAAKSVMTIHNLGYQGLFGSWAMDVLMLPWKHFNYRELEFWGKINYLKSGIVFADAITTVSRRYAEEIRTEEFGCGLQGVLEERKGRLYGIINGVDYDQWNPETDQLIPEQYSADDVSGKIVCRDALRQEFSLEKSDAPIIGIISRLADQKGFDLLAEAGEEIVAAGCQIVVLGTGDKQYQEYFTNLKMKLPGKVGVIIGFDNALAHRIEAGSDMFLMPSRYEPCGLNQMYSLKYGTIPIVRAVGGLDDSIEDADSRTGRGNGFKFTEYSSAALKDVVRRAIAAFNNKQVWPRLMSRAMSCDFSWEASAKKYEQLYERLLAPGKAS